MWNKIYLAILLVTVVIAGILTYFPYNWLQSVTDPRDVQTNYLYYSNLSWMFLLISTLILLILANVVLWMTRRAWAMWVSLLYFTIFTVANKFWLDRMFFSYQKANNLTDSFISFGALSGAVLIFLAAVIVFFDQYLVKRLHEKMYASPQPIESPPEESSADKEKI